MPCSRRGERYGAPSAGTSQRWPCAPSAPPPRCDGPQASPPPRTRWPPRLRRARVDGRRAARRDGRVDALLPAESVRAGTLALERRREAARERRGIEQPSLLVREHDSEPAQCLRGNARPEIQEADASRERLARLLEEIDRRRAGHEEATGAPTTPPALVDETRRLWRSCGVRWISSRIMSSSACCERESSGSESLARSASASDSGWR